MAFQKKYGRFLLLYQYIKSFVVANEIQMNWYWILINTQVEMGVAVRISIIEALKYTKNNIIKD